MTMIIDVEIRGREKNETRYFPCLSQRTIILRPRSLITLDKTVSDPEGTKQGIAIPGTVDEDIPPCQVIDEQHVCKLILLG